MLKKLISSAACLTIFCFMQIGIAASSVDSFGVINATHLKMNLISVKGENGIVIHEGCSLPHAIPTTQCPELSSTGCSGSIQEKSGTVVYRVEVLDTANGRLKNNNKNKYDVKVEWDTCKNGFSTITCASSSCSIPASNFMLAARYRTFDGHNVVIRLKKQ